MRKLWQGSFSKVEKLKFLFFSLACQTSQGPYSSSSYSIFEKRVFVFLFLLLLDYSFVLEGIPEG